MRASPRRPGWNQGASNSSWPRRSPPLQRAGGQGHTLWDLATSFYQILGPPTHSYFTAGIVGVKGVPRAHSIRIGVQLPHNANKRRRLCSETPRGTKAASARGGRRWLVQAGCRGTLYPSPGCGTHATGTIIGCLPSLNSAIIIKPRREKRMWLHSEPLHRLGSALPTNVCQRDGARPPRTRGGLGALASMRPSRR